VPQLNTADRIYLGTVPQDTIYLGPVKVWPIGLPQPDAVAHWSGGGAYVLGLTVEGIDGNTPGRYVVAVDPNPPASNYPDRLLGDATGTAAYSTMRWGDPNSTPVQIRPTPLRTWTNKEAVKAWAGHLVAFTVSGTRTVTEVEVLDPPAADYTAAWQQAGGVLDLVIGGGTDMPPENTVFTVAVAPITGEPVANPGWALGVGSDTLDAEITWHHDTYGDMAMPIQGTAYLGAKVTNSIAARDFPGRKLRITTIMFGMISLIELLP
jgi:hypothetical protein